MFNQITPCVVRTKRFLACFQSLESDLSCLKSTIPTMAGIVPFHSYAVRLAAKFEPEDIPLEHLNQKTLAHRLDRISFGDSDDKSGPFILKPFVNR